MNIAGYAKQFDHDTVFNKNKPVLAELVSTFLYKYTIVW